MLLEDKVFLVTGIANEKSIAWGVAKSLHREGAKLVFTYRKDKSFRKLMKLIQENEIEVLYITKCDILDDSSITEAFCKIEENVGKLDGLVHSIAFADVEELQGQYVDTTREGYNLANQSSVYSLVALAKQAQRLMKQGGSIVTQTYLGSDRVIKNYNVMGVAKAALEASVRYLAEDLGKYGIRVNAVSPGPIRTSASSVIPELDHILSMVEEKAPLRKNIELDEIGDATMFLLSHLSRGITGEVIHVDAGYNIVGL